jgi:DNA-binding transcriptional LysR family regulator
MIISLLYFFQASKELNFTKTAQRLFISQQTLSNHINRLEEYYHVRLFNRKPKLSLTESGKAMALYAEKMLTEELNLKNTLSDIENQNNGILRVGVTLPRGRIIFAKILPLFSNDFPDVSIEVENDTSYTLEQMVLNGKLDVAVGIYPQNHAVVEKIPVLREKIFFVVADRLLIKYYGDKALEMKTQASSGTHVHVFADLPLIFPSSSNRTTQGLLMCYEECDCKPHIYLSVTYPQFYLPLCASGVAACFVTQMSMHMENPYITTPLNMFPVLHQNKLLIHEVSIIYNKNYHMTKYCRRFIDLLVSFFQGLEKSPLFGA